MSIKNKLLSPYEWLDVHNHKFKNCTLISTIIEEYMKYYIDYKTKPPFHLLPGDTNKIN